jgi:hypothetical protein
MIRGIAPGGGDSGFTFGTAGCASPGAVWVAMWWDVPVNAIEPAGLRLPSARDGIIVVDALELLPAGWADAEEGAMPIIEPAAIALRSPTRTSQRAWRLGPDILKRLATDDLSRS